MTGFLSTRVSSAAPSKTSTLLVGTGSPGGSAAWAEQGLRLAAEHREPKARIATAGGQCPPTHRMSVGRGISRPSGTTNFS